MDHSGNGNFRRRTFLLGIGILGLALTCWLSTVHVAAAASLTISYFERPPYYFTTASGKPAGFLFERTRKVVEEAGIDANYISLTPYRIIYTLHHATTPHCSIGWFRNAERELFARFSEPIYRNQSLVLLTGTEQQKQFAGLPTLRKVFSRDGLTMARMAEFSYGTYVDSLLRELTPKSVFFTGNQSNLLQAIVDHRASYMLVAPEEITMLARSIGKADKDFVSFQLEDIPEGNLRYLMCNQDLDAETLGRLNNAIKKLYPNVSQSRQ